MKRNKTKKKFSLFSLAVTVLSLLLIVLVIVAVTNASPKKYDYRTEPSSLLYTLNRGRYAEALQDVANNRAMGYDEKTNADYEAPYAVCDYFEACSYYNACMKTGGAESAAVYEAKMQEAYERMGSLQMMAEEIRKALE